MSVFSSFDGSMARQESRVSLSLEQATALIVERAKQLVSQLTENRGHDKPPFFPEEFSSMLGIKKIVRADLGGTSGILLRFQDGYTIKVNQNHNLTRQNFSGAHEIGHILFNELSLEPYLQSIEYRTFNPKGDPIFNPQGELEARNKAKERLCDVAATELLMPEVVFSKYLSGFGVSVHSIERLANIFRVSFPAAAIRIAEVSEEACMALLWKPYPRNRPKGLRLDWCIGLGRKTIPVGTLVKPTSTLYKAYQDNSPVKSRVKHLPMESKGFGYGEKRYVISLAFLGK
ncbi:MAG: ImmA/IrrE family metallo-endopeptidase [Chloroflexi bacterium]|nr:ImmA/IrrE family metallo-endopeptidase [Chloroflexota bacterium]